MIRRDFHGGPHDGRTIGLPARYALPVVVLTTATRVAPGDGYAYAYEARGGAYVYLHRRPLGPGAVAEPDPYLT